MFRLKKSTFVLCVVLFIQLFVILVALNHPIILTKSYINNFEDYENHYNNPKVELEASMSKQLAQIRASSHETKLTELINEISTVTSTDLEPKFNSESQIFPASDSLPLSIQFAAMVSLVSFIPALTGIAAFLSKRWRKSKADEILLVIIFAVTFMGIVVYGQMSAQVLLSSFGQIWQGVGEGSPYPGAPSYTIWTDGTYTYAVDASGDLPEWASSTDASAVINNAISSTNGGKILLKSGTYYINANIDDNSKSNIELCGEGPATILKFANNRGQQEAGIWLEGSEGSEIKNWYIHDLTIDGNRDNQGGIAHGHWGMYLKYFDDSIVERVILRNFYGVPGGTWAGKGIDAHDCEKILITGCRWYGQVPETDHGRNGYIFTDCTGIIVDSVYGYGGSNGLCFHSGTTYSVCSNSIFEDFRFGGAVIYRNAFHNIIVGCTFEGRGVGSSQQGIYIQNSGYPELPSKGNIVTGNTIEGVDVAITIGQKGEANIIQSNTIYDDVTWGMSIQGERNIIANNVLYGNTVALRLSTSNAKENHFSDNALINPTVAIKIQEGYNNYFESNTIRGTVTISVQIDDGDNNVFEYCVFGSPSSDMIQIASGCDNNEIKYCDLTGYSGKISDSGNTIYKYNKGYLTENSGTATGTSPITVLHGLAGTPTIVVLGVKGTTVYSTSWTADATNIYIYHNAPASITVTWYAEL